ncbi:very short patch repair endonuclease [Sphingomonas quercus]|uniref:DNA mismatch endonuclease Vsr n=1 Tax=Sphingomonas quercus TaxID=2842451 RepID=A0ABS6BKN4_9SPHN|nr:DNA mismatch endonuclease Vsr [Sphingomonas quercus]MBU3078863.1 DNA mismatch endonuclease Vsr [Sphingomonas quercus]
MEPAGNVLSAEARRKMMAGFRSKDTKPEMMVRRALHRLGYRFRLHRSDLPGKPDIVLPRHRTVILVHGCFWHQHAGCRDARMPRTRQEYWAEKFRRNSERDTAAAAALAALGWNVEVIWECEARKPGLNSRLLELMPQRKPDILLPHHDGPDDGLGPAPARVRPRDPRDF